MLERTAAGLESRSLSFHRVLPHSTRTPRRPAVPTTSISQTADTCARHLCTGPSTRDGSTHDLRRSCRSDSSLQLDFLYPRQLPARPCQPQGALLPSQRNGLGYSKGPKGCRRMSTLTTSETVQDHHADPPADITWTNPAPPMGSRTQGKGERVSPEDMYALIKSGERGLGVATAERTARQDLNQRPSQNVEGSLESLTELLSHEEGERYHEVWNLFLRLSKDNRVGVAPFVVQYLSRSHGAVEVGRAMSLSRDIPTEDWTDKFVSSSILLCLQSGHQARAFEIFKTGLQSKSLVGGFEYILLDTVNKQEWSTALDVWLTYCKAMFNTPEKEIQEAPLEPLSSLSNLGALYFSFERYLAANDVAVERSMVPDKAARLALLILRIKFANEALNQPCSPEQALVILGVWRDHSLYESYMRMMLQRWYDNKISRSTVYSLLPIYDAYKTLPNCKPSLHVMRGIFKIHPPDNIAALENHYKDWIQFHGELNEWGFMKYLKIYARQGNVKKVRELWNRWMELYPARLNHPKGFRYTLNAYAQNGDVAGAEHEFERMTKQHQVRPDLDSWNVMLKCYMRASDFDKLLACFNEMKKHYQPDSFSYAHVMGMFSKKGDLGKTVELFNEAQENRVPLSREMALCLVVAHCLNNKLVEAEKITVELAQIGISSTVIWNQLIYHYGLHKQLNKCYRLLATMKDLNIEWDRDTLGFLLNSLTRLKRVSPAFQVIRDAVKTRFHLLQPEHFGIVMDGALRTKDSQTAEAIVSLMEKSSIPIPFNVLVAYAQMYLNLFPNSTRTPKFGPELVTSMRSLAAKGPGDLQRLKKETQSIGRAVALLTRLRHMDSVEDLISLLGELFPNYREGEPLPQDVLVSVMLAYERDCNFEPILGIWNQVWPKIKSRCCFPDGNRVYPIHEFEVADLVPRLVEAYKALGDGDGLIRSLDAILDAGFRLTSPAWNSVVRATAVLGKWERGMHWCETELMPNWRGWRPRKLPKAGRGKVYNTRYGKPAKETILALQIEWHKLRSLSAWSAEMARKLETLQLRYPLVHNAFFTSTHLDSHGPWMFRGDMHFERAMKYLLQPLSSADLHIMKGLLGKQLKRQKKSGVADGSLFQMMDPRDLTAKNLKQGELAALLSTLQENLDGRSTLSSKKEESGK